MQGADGVLPLTSSENALRARLEGLRGQHDALEHELAETLETVAPNVMAVRRLKKRKLLVRDEITRLENTLYPDIIA